MKHYHELNNNQRRNLLDNFQMFDAYLDAISAQKNLRGSMIWQKMGDREYLIRAIDGRTRKSMGPRSPKTEALFQAFRERKQSVKDRLGTLKDGLQQQAGVCRALQTGRVPRLVGNILRSIAAVSLQHKTTTVIGTHALYAYEGMAGVQFDSSIMATNDLDILWDARSRLKLSSAVPAEGLMGILRKVDHSFEIMDKARYRAVNRDGFMVDLLQDRLDMRVQPENSFAVDDAFVAVEADMKWLVSSPKVQTMTLDEDGYPVPMAVPDPRAFAIHKLWLSMRPDRDPIKKPRDAAQAIALANLTVNLLPQYPFSDAAVRIFPKAVTAKARNDLFAVFENDEDELAI
jgi:hypothetical protein